MINNGQREAKRFWIKIKVILGFSKQVVIKYLVRAVAIQPYKQNLIKKNVTNVLELRKKERKKKKSGIRDYALQMYQ